MDAIDRMTVHLDGLDREMRSAREDMARLRLEINALRDELKRESQRADNTLGQLNAWMTRAHRENQRADNTLGQLHEWMTRAHVAEATLEVQNKTLNAQAVAVAYWRRRAIELEALTAPLATVKGWDGPAEASALDRARSAPMAVGGAEWLPNGLQAGTGEPGRGSSNDWRS